MDKVVFDLHVILGRQDQKSVHPLAHELIRENRKIIFITRLKPLNRKPEHLSQQRSIYQDSKLNILECFESPFSADLVKTLSVCVCRSNPIQPHPSPPYRSSLPRCIAKATASNDKAQKCVTSKKLVILSQGSEKKVGSIRRRENLVGYKAICMQIEALPVAKRMRNHQM